MKRFLHLLKLTKLLKRNKSKTTTRKKKKTMTMTMTTRRRNPKTSLMH